MSKHFTTDNDSLLDVISHNKNRAHDSVANGLSAKEIQTGKNWSLEQWRDHYKERLRTSQLVGERAQLHQQIIAVEKQISAKRFVKQKEKQKRTSYTRAKDTYDREKLGENYKRNQRRPKNHPDVIREGEERAYNKYKKSLPKQRRNEQRVSTQKMGELMSKFNGSLKGSQFINA